MRIPYKHFEAIEKRAGLLGVLIACMVALGGLAEITPLFMKAHEVEPAAGVEPYDALRLAGRDVYVREGCYLCHSQMIRTLRFETQRYGDYSTAGEFVYDRPFQWGSKRTGPDLARIGGKYTDEWQRLHLISPRAVVPESNMPNYPWLGKAQIDAAEIQVRMRGLKRLGDPYGETQIEGAPAALEGKTELDAIVAYLQGLGRAAPAAPIATTAAPIATTAETAAPMAQTAAEPTQEPTPSASPVRSEATTAQARP